MTTLQVKSTLKDPKRVLLALGSNVDKWHHLSYAVAQLRQRWHVVWQSDILETEAVGMEVPSFCNMLVVLAVENTTYEALHAVLKEMECAMGSSREDRKRGYVVIDLDILAYQSQRYHQADWSRPYVRTLLQSMPFEW